MAADRICHSYSAIDAGRFECSEYRDRHEYLEEIERVSKALRAHISTMDERYCSLLLNRLNRIQEIGAQLRLSNFDGSLRRQPYCVLLEGYPGTGKSSLAMNIAQKLMERTGKPLGKDEIVILNESDEFQSEYRSHHRVVIFDDVYATEDQFDTIDPMRKVIDFVNNITKTSLNPNLQLKGNVLIRPELVILTSNRSLSSSIKKSIAPEALWRRFQWVIRLYARDNIQYFRANLPKLAPGKDITVYTREVDWERKHISADVFYESIADDFDRFREDQKDFIRRVNDRFAESSEIPQKDYSFTFQNLKRTFGELTESWFPRPKVAQVMKKRDLKFITEERSFLDNFQSNVNHPVNFETRLIEKVVASRQFPLNMMGIPEWVVNPVTNQRGDLLVLDETNRIIYVIEVKVGNTTKLLAQLDHNVRKFNQLYRSQFRDHGGFSIVAVALNLKDMSESEIRLHNGPKVKLELFQPLRTVISTIYDDLRQEIDANYLRRSLAKCLPARTLSDASPSPSLDETSPPNSPISSVSMVTTSDMKPEGCYEITDGNLKEEPYLFFALKPQSPITTVLPWLEFHNYLVVEIDSENSILVTSEPDIKEVHTYLRENPVMVNKIITKIPSCGAGSTHDLLS